MEIENSTNNLVNTLTPDSMSSFSTASSDVADTTSSFFPKMILIIIIIAFIGGFVFIYLAKGDKSFTEFVTHYLNKLGIDIGKTYETDHGRTGETGGTGIERTGIERTGEPMDTTIDTTTPIYSTNKDTSKTETNDDADDNDDDASVECDNPTKEKLMKALNNAAQTAEYMADDASSSIQSVNKSKWCFIGEEKGVRNCVLLNDEQKCMSGDIFPSRDICINPKIRT